MKRAGIVSIVLLLSLSIVGCCTPGYYGGSPCGIGGCGSLMHKGVVDYVDGGPGACEANCGGGYANNYASGYGYGGCPPRYSNGANCLGNLVNGIFVLGEGAFCLAASPFVLVGNLICGGCAGYETYPNCGCSNEVYYGDNCLQPQDYCNPCTNVSNGCGCGSGVATSNCTRCSGGYTEGIQYEGNVVQKQSTAYRPLTQPARNPTAYSAQVNQNRPVAQTMYRQQPQRQSAPPQRQMPPRPALYDDENQTAAAL